MDVGDANMLANTVLAAGTYNGWGGSDVGVILADAIGINLRIWVPALRECKFFFGPQIIIHCKKILKNRKKVQTSEGIRAAYDFPINVGPQLPTVSIFHQNQNHFMAFVPRQAIETKHEVPGKKEKVKVFFQIPKFPSQSSNS